MKTLYSLFVAALSVAVLTAPVAADGLSVGDRVENFTLANYDGAEHSLDQYLSDENTVATVILFIATQCPISNDYNSRMVGLYNEYSPRGIAFVGINPNKQEPVEEVAEHAREHGLTFPVLKDHNNVIADVFGAAYTPEIYVLNPDGAIVYHGRIDDSRRPERIESRDLKDALDAILAGAEIEPAVTQAFGCTIKRVD